MDGKDVSSFSRDESLSFGRDMEYSALPGVTTFGGNNYRNTFSYGTVTMTDKAPARKMDEDDRRAWQLERYGLDRAAAGAVAG